MHINRARENAKVQLHTNIARTYLQLGQLRMARIYVNRICFPLSVEDDEGYQVKFFLNLPEDENREVYAELLFVAAQISIASGNEGHAQGELEEACRHDPDRDDIRRLMKQCKTRQKDRRQRRQERKEKTWAEQDRSYERKCEGMCLRAGIQRRLTS